jgi:hypothetical protein
MENKNNLHKLICSNKNKKAEILTENLMFILLNLAFFAILAIFIFIKADDPARLEEAYAKKIALILDAAKPGMDITIDMQGAIDKKDKEYTGKIVDIQGNVVTVKLRQEKGYSYSFFNDISLTKYYFYSSDSSDGKYSFKVEGYNK